jgi:hypothetical protein
MRFRRLSQDYPQLNWCGSWFVPNSAGRPFSGDCCRIEQEHRHHENDQALRPRVDERYCSVAPLSKPLWVHSSSELQTPRSQGDAALASHMAEADRA